uniref:Uncharacterized protein n=1 Tax=Medicago truncatula TaxID=3880 RepID=I3SP92_MEDTR|nr:unknown [Medicago truncatula]
MILSRYVLPFSTSIAYVCFSEQGKSGPGFPLIVCASDIFGGNPIWFPWFTISSTSLCHHSPSTISNSLAGCGKGKGVPGLGMITIAP